MSESTVWVACDVKSPDGKVFELIGVFDSEYKASAACTMSNHCYFPMTLNTIAPAETTVAPDVRWPILERAEQSEAADEGLD
jgi:hypothetical protein